MAQPLSQTHPCTQSARASGESLSHHSAVAAHKALPRPQSDNACDSHLVQDLPVVHGRHGERVSDSLSVDAADSEDMDSALEAMAEAIERNLRTAQKRTSALTLSVAEDQNQVMGAAAPIMAIMESSSCRLSAGSATVHQSETLVNESAAPMHVFLGIVNDVIDHEWILCLGEQHVKDVLTHHRVYFDRHHSHSMSGNGVKNLLNSITGILTDLAPHAPLNFQTHYSCFFQNLLEIYRLCMRADNLSVLDINWFAVLCQRYVTYRQSCLYLMHGNAWHRRLTPKEHTMLCHFQQFMSKHHSLGRFSEQSHECVHHQFNMIADMFKAEHNFIDKLPFILRSLNEANLYRLNPNV